LEIRYGDVITEEIKPSGNMDVYTFVGKAGDVAHIAAAGTKDAPWLSLKIQVFDSQGQPVGAESYGDGEYNLAADGRYIFTVRDSDTRTGPYNVVLKNVAPGAGVRLVYGDSVESEITIAGETHAYAFTGKAGGIARIALTDRGNETRECTVGLFDPQGTSLAGSRTWGPGGFTAIIERTLITDGEYTIKVRVTGLLDTPKTGPYALLLRNVSANAGTRFAYGDVVTGTIAPEGDKDIYVFDWKAGEEVLIEAERGGGALQVEVLDSQRNSLAVGVASYPQQTLQIKPALTEDGIYMIVVEGKEHVFWSTGSYTLSLTNLAAP
jgi:hypothetical protein